MNPEYQHLAYQRSLLATFRRQLEDDYLPNGGSTKKEVICEVLPREISIVPKEEIIFLIQRLQEDEKHLTQELASYEFTKRPHRPLVQVPVAAATEQPEPEQSEPERPAGKTRKPRAKPAGTDGGA